MVVDDAQARVDRLCREDRQQKRGEDAGAAPEQEYPDTWAAGERRLPLSYLFRPGDPHDGVTLTVPLSLLNTVDANRLGWQVPALRRELVTELLRSLPKPQRRALTPLPQFADAALERLGTTPAGNLSERIAEAIEASAGVQIRPRDFDWEALPVHLRPRIVVTDEEGGVLAAGENALGQAIEAAGEPFGIDINDFTQLRRPGRF